MLATAATATETYTVDTANLPELAKRFAAANRRLDRNGIDGAFTLRELRTWTEYAEDRAPATWTEIEVTRPEAKLGDWTVVATVELEEGGTVLRIAEGHSLEGYTRPEAHVCEHCGKARRRATSYILRDYATGETKQVGKSCLQTFTGFDVKGLWTLTTMTAEEIAELEAPNTGYGNPAVRYPVRWIFAAAAYATNGGPGYVSRAAATEHRASTANQVLGIFHFRPGRDAELNAEMAAANSAIYALLESNDPIIDATYEAIAAMRPGTDYADNMAVVAASEYISSRSFGYAVSGIAVLHRARTTEAERAARYAAEREARETVATGYLGEAKDKLTGIEATITGVRELDSDWGTTYLLSFRTASGHIAKWFASNDPGFELGDEVTIERATVKKQEQYNGTDQTVITRAKLAAR